MKVGIIVYPGSNCDKDTYNYFTHHGCECFYIWHHEDKLEKHIDLFVSHIGRKKKHKKLL